MQAKILCVDDDPYILEGYKRQLRKMFDLHIALGGESALNIIKKEGPFSVVVTDMNMPEMNGIEFLKRVRQIAPDTVRIMLTGMSDLQVAINAVNEGYVFRFLTKPSESKTILETLSAAIIQYRLITAEKELQEKTLTGIIKLLIEVLETINYIAFSRSMRIKDYVVQMATMLKLEPLWQYEIAALLSQIGCVMIPADILEKVIEGRQMHNDELELFKSHAEIGSRLISSIPRLETVSKIIANQYIPFSDYSQDQERRTVNVSMGAQLIKIANDFDMLLGRYMSIKETILVMKSNSKEYNPDILLLLEYIKIPVYDNVIRILTAKDLYHGMVVAENVFSKNGTMIIGKGKELTENSILRIRNFVQQDIIPNCFKIKIPTGSSH